MADSFRALCEQFADTVDLLCSHGESRANPGSRLILTAHVDALEELAAAARTLLAQPEPKKSKPVVDYSRVPEIATEAQIRSAAQYLVKKRNCDGDLIPAIKYAIARWGSPTPQLAQPEGEELTDEELNNIHIDLVLPGLDSKVLVVDSAYERCLMRAAIAADRARRPSPQPPADGEVAELVGWLRTHASAKNRMQRESFTRAAELLQRQHPQPVPVSERLPGATEWVWHCYAGVRFWQHGRYNGRQFFIGDGPESQPATHWLPAHALPLPTIEEFTS